MLRSLTPVDGEVVLPLADLKARLRVLDTAEDADIRRMRGAAIDFVERYSGKALDQRQFQWTDRQFFHAFRFPIGPVMSVDAISYYDGSGTDIALTSADWYFGGDVLHSAHGKTWPYANGLPGGVRITFTAGFMNAEAEAPFLIAAVEVAIAAMRENRENPDLSAAMACADRYRVPVL